MNLFAITLSQEFIEYLIMDGIIKSGLDTTWFVSNDETKTRVIMEFFETVR